MYFRDPADHVCLHCKQIFLNAKTYLEHLKSPEHAKQYLVRIWAWAVSGGGRAPGMAR